MVDTKRETLLIRMSTNLKEALKIASKKDSRSMASLIEKLIKDYLEKENIPWNE
jgi:predicted DNA-binding protein